jgi:hypothetical protein
MNNLIIEKTKYTMDINFNKDSGILEMSGSSYPENALEFFGPITDWLKEFIRVVQKNLTMNIRLNYLNTSSTKCILDIFEILDSYHKSLGHVLVKWLYAENDEDIRETGEELAEDFEFQIEFVSFK